MYNFIHKSYSKCNLNPSIIIILVLVVIDGYAIEDMKFQAIFAIGYEFMAFVNVYHDGIS